MFLSSCTLAREKKGNRKATIHDLCFNCATGKAKWIACVVCCVYMLFFSNGTTNSTKQNKFYLNARNLFLFNFWPPIEFKNENRTHKILTQNYPIHNFSHNSILLAVMKRNNLRRLTHQLPIHMFFNGSSRNSWFSKHTL